MSRYVFDIESDGFVKTMTRVHSLVLKDIDTLQVYSCHNGGPGTYPAPPGIIQLTIEQGLKMLMEADLIIGHNIIKFDIPAIQKIYPWFEIDPEKVFDTLVASRLIWTQLVDTDMGRIRAGKTGLPSKLAGSHGLEAWGYRLDRWKGDYSKLMVAKGLDPWAHWNPEMQSYCEQDVEVNEALYLLIMRKDYAQTALDLEHRVAFIMAECERNGFRFNSPEADKLLLELSCAREDMLGDLRDIFPPWWVPDGPMKAPKRSHKTLGYWGTGAGASFEGFEYQKVKLAVFNPNSRDHIAGRLTAKYRWRPQDYTPTGKPKVDETVLGALPYPEAKRLAEFMTIQKRIAQIGEGDMAWLKKVEEDGRIHGSIITNGAVTGRATHSHPNIAQVPKVGSIYGAECRALFTATPGKTMLLGCDVSGLELRMLGHFMAAHDGGAYAEIVINGDVHSANAAALNGMPLSQFLSGRKSEVLVTSIAAQIEDAYKWLQKQPAADQPLAMCKDYYKHLRETAKTFIYAFLYGAGNAKLGSIMLGGPGMGKALKAKFFKQFPALKKLIDGVVGAAETRGTLTGLDKRLLHVRSPHSALNTLLQSAGALVCKQWIIEFDRLLKERGLNHLVWLVAWVHDELQMEVDLSLIETDEAGKHTSVIGDICIEAIVAAGLHFDLRVPLTGEYAIGHNWKETH